MQMTVEISTEVYEELRKTPLFFVNSIRISIGTKMAVSATTICGNPSILIIQSVFQLNVLETEKMDIVCV